MIMSHTFTASVMTFWVELLHLGGTQMVCKVFIPTVHVSNKVLLQAPFLNISSLKNNGNLNVFWTNKSHVIVIQTGARKRCLYKVKWTPAQVATC